jgi:hypothetical protein
VPFRDREQTRNARDGVPYSSFDVSQTLTPTTSEATPDSQLNSGFPFFVQILDRAQAVGYARSHRSRAGQFSQIRMASGRCQPAGTSQNPMVDTLGSPEDIADAHITQIESLTSPITAALS